MSAAQKTGGTYRDTLLSVWEKTGERPPELVDVDLPDMVHHVWDWFIKLSKRRVMGAMAPNPITYQDILAWSFLTGADPTPFEVDCILEVDQAWLSSAQKDQ